MISMTIMIGLCAPLPYVSKPIILQGGPYCNYRVGSHLSYGVLASCALFDIINFTLLYLKLVKSGQGLRGLLRSLAPMTKAAYDHEEVARMLLQKTFIFIAAQFGILISLAILYATTTEQNFQLMQVAAFQAVSTMICGRIFRKAWKLTREQSPANIALPPDYSPDWARVVERDASVAGGAQGSEGLGGIDGTPVLVKKESKSLRDDASYIEGEINYSIKESKSSILPRTQDRNGSIAHSHVSRRSMADDSSQRSQPQSQSAVAIEMGDVPMPAASATAASASPLAVPSKKIGGIGRNSRDKRRAVTSHGASSSSSPDIGGSSSRQRPSTSYTPTISAPVQIISPGADANSSSAFISSKGDGTTPYSSTARNGSSVKASVSSQTLTPAVVALASSSRQAGKSSSRGNIGEVQTAGRPRSSSSVVSSTSSSSFPPTAITADQQPRRGSATPLRTTFVASPPMTAASTLAPATLTIGPSSSSKKTVTPTLSRRPSAVDDEQSAAAPDPLDAFRSAVHADEARHASGSSGLDVGGRPTTSRGGPVAPFGSRERTRSHSTDKTVTGVSVGSAVAAKPSSSVRPVSPARPGTSHGPASAAPAGSFVRLRASPPSTAAAGVSGSVSSSQRPGTASDAPTSKPPPAASTTPLSAPVSPKSSSHAPLPVNASATAEPPASASSAIDEAYRELEEMASLSRTNSIATTSAHTATTVDTSEGGGHD